MIKKEKKLNFREKKSISISKKILEIRSIEIIIKNNDFLSIEKMIELKYEIKLLKIQLDMIYNLDY